MNEHRGGTVESEGMPRLRRRNRRSTRNNRQGQRMKRKTLPSKEEVLSVLKYNRRTGEFFWKARQDQHFNARLVGKKA